MADVDARGDGHGDPPPVGGCAASAPTKTRGKTKNKKLLAIWIDKGSKPLPINFDFDDQRTLRPVGKYSSDFKSLLGVTLRQSVPFTYDSWDRVPKDTKTAIYPQLQTYFDIGRYIGPTGVYEPLDRGINKLCSTLYSNAKHHFKKKHFFKLGGYDNVENIRRIVPPNMGVQAWKDLVDFYVREDNLHKSKVNSDNRACHRYPTTQGSKSIAEIRHDRCEPDGTYPSLIDLFKEKHSKKRKNGQISDTALSNVALQAYERMKKLRDDQQGVENPMTEEEIMDEVLGKRRGFKRGRGLIVPGYTCSPSSPVPGPSTPPGRVYTQAEVDALLKAALKETKETKRTASILGKKVDIMAKAMADNGFDVEWEEVEEEEEEEEEGEHDLNSD